MVDQLNLYCSFAIHDNGAMADSSLYALDVFPATNSPNEANLEANANALT